MEGERGVLQDGIETAAFGLGRDAQEGIGGEDDEEQEGHGDAGLHGQHVGAQGGGQIAAEEGDGGAEDGEDQHPQQHGALVVPPHAGDFVDQRLGRVRVGPHRLDGEVRRDVGVHEGEEGREHEAELDEGGRRGNGHQARIALPRAPRGQRHLHECGGKREDEGEMS